ncbi:MULTISPECIES: DUF3604 domain-containing protein [unclassified Ruegeria]|uniref:DUF3604 domain-containing protein n=1 Tax=unclassified Ruegeria TaxID=2625375 RepID=UPI001ADB490B|nr:MULTISPECIES: DUF3604 domain-containing protein [unclassified Ruegeria]MBO9410953.1 DUF3604 domain-containing protein [Ruegeria sp. R8_1]MBO9415154.1 DUF3604 domain-containing protein [Ruegeria sp. R8_2]
MLGRYACLLTLLGVPLSALADAIPTKEAAEGTFAERPFSPYANRSFPERPLWGDTHLHTGLSLDAGAFGNTLLPDEAWRFAKGEQVISSTGQPVRLARPLDWMVLTDHTDLMGFAPDLQAGKPGVISDPKGLEWYEGYKAGGEEAGKTAFDIITNFSQMTLPEILLESYSPGADAFAFTWENIVLAAERHNDPGTFTAFIGFEWTSVPKGFNLHRNVMLRDGPIRALQMVPPVTQPPYGNTDPKALYSWLEEYQAKTGGRAVAFAHNGNLSNGWMFPTEDTYHGGKVDEEYVKARAKWEPHYEVTQIKGDGEAHPFLSPDDEFADYENWDVGNLDITELKTDDMLAGEYAREALKRGLLLEEKFGVNPYKFGMGGATDSHTSLATAEEDNFFGKSVSVEPSAERIKHPFIANDLGEIPGDLLVASGYTAVWATENTRAAIFDAFKRRETYATTGPRIGLRFFGGWAFDDSDIETRFLADVGYTKGVPMGSDLRPREGDTAPSFLIAALRDPIGANLDRAQVIKGWLDSEGELHEKVYDVVWSDDRTADDSGKIPAVGNTVDIDTASWTNTIGSAELVTVWTDPDFDPDVRSFYYVRAIEIPTPRWVLYDKVRFGTDLPENAQLTHQERAYSSPIWYTPSE